MYIEISEMCLKIISPLLKKNISRYWIIVQPYNNNIIYSAILLPELPSSAILESTPERNQRNQRCLNVILLI